MRYPTITIDEVSRIVRRCLAKEGLELDGAVRYVGDGDDVDLSRIAAVGKELSAVVDGLPEGTKVGDALEGEWSGRVHAALGDLPLEVLDDPGFWRYLGIGLLWTFVYQRQQTTFEESTPDQSEEPAPPSAEGFMKYVDGKSPEECIALRMFLRGQIALRDSDYELASKATRATDFWRSHILRVRTAYWPTLAQSLVELQAADPLPTKPLREHAKRIKRVASNVLLQTYNKDQADALLRELRPKEEPTGRG